MARPFTFADTIEVVADTVPDHLALITEGRRITYRELDDRATQLAHALQARGVGTGDHIGLYLHNGTEYVEAMLAAWKIRAVPVNVNYRYVEDELVYLFDDDAQDAAEKQCGVKILDPLPYLCDANYCYGSKNGRPLYHDDDHLSEYGNKFLIPMFERIFMDQAG